MRRTSRRNRTAVTRTHWRKRSRRSRASGLSARASRRSRYVRHAPGADHYLEDGEGWYRRLNGYARTPGARTAAGTKYQLLDPSAGLLRCFACHSTGPVSLAADDAIVPSARLDAVLLSGVIHHLPHELGVRCEACHGPAAAHVRDPAHVHPLNPGRLPADQLNAFCGWCHRMPAGAAWTPDLRNPWNARHQPLMLAASACFRESKGRLTCLTCHFPHAPLEQKLAAYDAFCAGCHAQPKHKQAVAEKPARNATCRW